MLRTKLSELFRVAISELIGEGRLPADVLSVPIEIADPKNSDHGDFACNFAMVASKKAGMNPRAIGEMVAEKLGERFPNILTDVEVAGPGFINLRLSAEFVAGYVATVNQEGFRLESASHTPNPQRINVEFVSVNPNGPITIGSGRGAAYGSTLCNVLEAVGHTVHREYYINDGVSSTQMALFAESVKAIVEGRPVPDNGYKGDYVHEVAESLISMNVDLQTLGDEVSAGVMDLGIFHALEKEFSDPEVESIINFYLWNKAKDFGIGTHTFKELSVELNIADYQFIAQSKMLAAQKRALFAFGVEYDTWFSEQSLHDSGVVNSEIDAMIDKGIADFDPTRAKLKLAKGFKIEDVIFESQTAAMETEEDAAPLGGAGEPGEPEGDEFSLDDLVPTLLPIAEPSMEGSIADAEPFEAPISLEGETLWLRSTKLGDDMDRVLRRRDGRLTYIASDVAYHKDKFKRPANADKLITILGPDHHGYIGRLTAVVAAMLMEKPHPGTEIEDPIAAKLYKDSGEQEACEKALADAKSKLEVQIYQLVRFLKDGKPAPMRKRDGNIYALIDLMREIGVKLKPEATETEQLAAGRDVARFFYLMRSHDTTFDFDLDLAEKQSDENPVFYVQYAHARICSILAKANTPSSLVEANTPSSLGEEGAGDGGDRPADGSSEATTKPGEAIERSEEKLYKLLTHEREKALIKKIVDLPDEVRRASEDYGVHRLATYSIELARAFHYFYDGCRVIQTDQPELTAARLELCKATAKTLKTTLRLLGVSAPEKM